MLSRSFASVAEKYTSPTRSFRVMDLTKDELPDCDLVLVRACFIHLSFELMFAALRNITRSKIRYLLTTQFVDVKVNVDIKTGAFHYLNLCNLRSIFHRLSRSSMTMQRDFRHANLLCGWSMTCVMRLQAALMFRVKSALNR